MPILGENSRDELGGARRGGATKKPERERERSGQADEDHREDNHPGGGGTHGSPCTPMK
jgi:hypothetical protein